MLHLKEDKVLVTSGECVCAGNGFLHNIWRGGEHRTSMHRDLKCTKFGRWSICIQHVLFPHPLCIVFPFLNSLPIQRTQDVKTSNSLFLALKHLYFGHTQKYLMAA